MSGYAWWPKLIAVPRVGVEQWIDLRDAFEGIGPNFTTPTYTDQGSRFVDVDRRARRGAGQTRATVAFAFQLTDPTLQATIANVLEVERRGGVLYLSLDGGATYRRVQTIGGDPTPQPLGAGRKTYQGVQLRLELEVVDELVGVPELFGRVLGRRNLNPDPTFAASSGSSYTGSGWDFVTTGGTVTIEAGPAAGGNALRLTRDTLNNSLSALFPFRGLVPSHFYELEFDLRTNADVALAAQIWVQNTRTSELAKPDGSTVSSGNSISVAGSTSWARNLQVFRIPTSWLRSDPCRVIYIHRPLDVLASWVELANVSFAGPSRPSGVSAW